MNREHFVKLIRERLIFVKVATALLWLSWLASIALSGFKKDIEGKPIGTDHIAFYSAAKLISDGQGDRIYDWEFLGHVQAEITGGGPWYLDAYRNPPFYALLYVPTAHVPYLLSFWIWTAIGVALLWFGLGWLGTENRFAAFVLSLSFYPVFSVFSFGQNSLLSFGAFCLTFHSMERNRFFLAGMAAGLLLFKPQLLLGLGVWWLLHFRRYIWCWIGLTTMAFIWLVISILFVPVESRLFLEKLRAIAGYDAFMFWNLHNPKGFWTLITFDNKKIGSNLGLTCSIAAVIFFICFWRKQKDNLPFMFAGAVYVTLWASPHTMIYEWTLAVIPAVLLWDRAKSKRDDWIIVFSIAWVVLFISTPIAKTLFEWTFDPNDTATKPGWAIQISVPVLGLLGIWSARILNWNEGPTPSEPPPKRIAEAPADPH